MSRSAHYSHTPVVLGLGAKFYPTNQNDDRYGKVIAELKKILGTDKY
jgi:hypothetical protein